MSKYMKQRFIGCMIGSALGDAIGEIVLYHAKSGFISIDDLSLVIDRETLLADIRTFPQLKYTDDTHMAIGIAEALSRSGGFDLDQIKRRFLINYQSEPWRGYGLGPSTILSSTLMGHMSYNEAVQNVNAKYKGGSLGNGAVMRTHPVALRYHESPNLTEIASSIAALTHLHPVAQDAAAVLTHAIAFLLHNSNQLFSQEQFLRYIIGTAQTSEMQEKLQLIQSLLNDQTTPLHAMERLGCGIEAHNSLPYAIYSFLLHPESYEECLMAAILNGGDTDTLGAITGSLSGAQVGIDSIPRSWLEKLENEAHIKKLAQKLYKVQLRSSGGRRVKNERNN